MRALFGCDRSFAVAAILKWIYALFPRFQGLGLGMQLIDFVEQQARGGGYGSIELYTNAKMTENLGLYPRLGYVEFDRRHEAGFDRVYFQKKL